MPRPLCDREVAGEYPLSPTRKAGSIPVAKSPSQLADRGLAVESYAIEVTFPEDVVAAEYRLDFIPYLPNSRSARTFSEPQYAESPTTVAVAFVSDPPQPEPHNGVGGVQPGAVV